MSKFQSLIDQPFPFMELPPELRDMVYEHLVEDINPQYPLPAPQVPASPLLSWLMPVPQWPTKPADNKPKPTGSCLLLANKQIHAEFTSVLCKRSTFHLSVSPSNYSTPTLAASPKASDDTTTAAAPAAPSTLAHAAASLWNIAPDMLKAIRKCDIKLVITSAMLGTSDPRNVTPDSWALAHQVRNELRNVSNVQELNLHVKAIGDPLWNPLWVWYHATQSFKNMGTTSTSTSSTSCCAHHTPSSAPAGPKLNRITFSLDTFSPGENHLERDSDNGMQWSWMCPRGHSIGPDGGADVPVREFCANLYKECRTCRPDLDDESDEEW